MPALDSTHLTTPETTRPAGSGDVIELPGLARVSEAPPVKRRTSAREGRVYVGGAIGSVVFALMAVLVVVAFVRVRRRSHDWDDWEDAPDGEPPED
jgi:hypothetical protein